MANEAVRKALKENHMRQWQLAVLLGVSEQTMYRKLRTDLPEEEQKKMIGLINNGEGENK